MAKTALITGITGQDGSYMAEFLLHKKYEVHGMIRRASTFNTERIDHIYMDPHNPKAKLFLHYGDLSNSEQVSNVINNIAPDEVYHLGAQSHVRVSFDMPEYITYDVIKYLESMEYTTKIQIRKKRRIFELSMYYIAAACVTYLLIFNGFFNFLDKKASDVANNMTKNMSELSLNIPELNISAFNKILIKFNERVIEE